MNKKEAKTENTKNLTPENFIEGLVALDKVELAVRKTKIDYEAIKAQIETKLPNGQTAVLFMKKSNGSVSMIKVSLIERYPALKGQLQIVKAKSGQIGLALKPTA